ncbi:olfactory receptor 867-like [Mirounga leonina]|uniref:olfactory receptor 867-like n=1 Tax=Mirounga leonina TaxID=9715 RepID=UPI00156C5972|nr:olfactory receptor 867-like [Mirounga leonina]
MSTRFINNVGPRNKTGVSEFLLGEVTEDPELKHLLFILFLSIYLVTILGNLLIILAVSSDSYLHTPMYFFLSNLSFTDICLSTTTIPKMLVTIQAQNQSITYTGCLTQIYVVLAFGGLESFLLAVMAYDRYVAICHSLRYTVIMNSHLCGMLVLLSFIFVVSLFYGTGLGVYISSALSNSSRNTAVVSVMYSVVPQMMNPFIYSLKNRDMKGALKKLTSRTPSL